MTLRQAFGNDSAVAPLRMTALRFAVILSEATDQRMLMTGAKDDATLSFYRRAGCNSEDKTAFIQRLD